MIKFFVMDVDGTLTDGMIYVGNDGEVFKPFNCKDGYGIHHILPDNNIVPVIITGRNSHIMENRAKELSIKELHQGVSDKVGVLMEVLERFSKAEGKNYTLADVAYVGDDLNDFKVMKAIRDNGGVTGCPADADGEIKGLAQFVSTKDGGRGAVREFMEYIIKRNK